MTDETECRIFEQPVPPGVWLLTDVRGDEQQAWLMSDDEAEWQPNVELVQAIVYRYDNGDRALKDAYTVQGVLTPGSARDLFRALAPRHDEFSVLVWPGLPSEGVIIAGIPVFATFAQARNALLLKLKAHDRRLAARETTTEEGK